MPHIKKGKLFFRHKYVYSDSTIVEMRVWKVPKSFKTPEGYKYSLVYIDAEKRRIFGYDNAEGKGHHRHEGKIELPVAFKSLDQVIEEFWKAVQNIRRQYES